MYPVGIHSWRALYEASFVGDALTAQTCSCLGSSSPAGVSDR